MKKTEKYLNLGFLLILAGNLSSCLNKKIAKNDGSRARCAVFQAKHADIPTPLGSTVLSSRNAREGEDEAGDVEVLTAQCDLCLEDLCNFYSQELLAQGWDINNFSTAAEALFVCEKPHKECVVLSSASKDCKSKVEIFVKPKSVHFR
ncbi:hypothetical protein ACFLY6_02650 [Candidatus Dependentiae bacterium]